MYKRQLIGLDKNLRYSQQDIASSNDIATNCAKRFGTHDGEDTDFEWINDGKAYKSILCNDGHSQYQGDYYHVITSSFLFCRSSILNKNSSKFLQNLRDRLYIENVKRYKIKRFQETASKIKNKYFKKIILKGIRNIEKEIEYLEPYSSSCLLYTSLQMCIFFLN